MKTKFSNGKFITTTNVQENTIEGIYYGFRPCILISIGRQFNQDTGNIEIWIYKGVSSDTVLFHSLINRLGKLIQ